MESRRFFSFSIYNKKAKNIFVNFLNSEYFYQKYNGKLDYNGIFLVIFIK